MKNKKLEDKISDFFTLWTTHQMTQFIKDVVPLIELFDFEDNDDWLLKEVGAEDEQNVRILRTVYLLSRFADFHAGILCNLNFRFKDLWKKMEKYQA